MKKFNFNKLLALGLMMSVCAFYSCDDGEDKLPAPSAGFTSVIDGKTVTLTNTTEGEENTYQWDFGDGNTSTTESPEHTYEANGSYVITLTATNESGTDDSQAAVEIINITIDGDLSDWDDVAALGFTGEGSLVEIKMENLDNQKLFVYVKGASESSSFLDFWLNMDYQATVDEEQDSTGFHSLQYPSSALGYDLLFEGFFGTAAGREFHVGLDEGSGGMYFLHLYPNDDDDLLTNNTAFSGDIWNQMSYTDALNATDMVSLEGNVAYEFSIDLQALPESLIPESGDAIQFFIDEWVNSSETADGWWGSFTGHYPEGQGAEGAEAATYTLK